MKQYPEIILEASYLIIAIVPLVFWIRRGRKKFGWLLMKIYEILIQEHAIPN